MGVYLNPGKQSFQMAVNSEIFVDKTEIISYINSVINTNQRYISVSRPRRFGKTMAADMICAYYDRTADSRTLFDQTKLSGNSSHRPADPAAGWDQYLGSFNVIRIVMTDFIRIGEDISKSLQKMEKRILKDLEREYPDIVTMYRKEFINYIKLP